MGHAVQLVIYHPKKPKHLQPHLFSTDQIFCLCFRPFRSSLWILLKFYTSAANITTAGEGSSQKGGCETQKWLTVSSPSGSKDWLKGECLSTHYLKELTEIWGYNGLPTSLKCYLVEEMSETMIWPRIIFKWKACPNLCRVVGSSFPILSAKSQPQRWLLNDKLIRHTTYCIPVDLLFTQTNNTRYVAHWSAVAFCWLILYLWIKKGQI